MIELRYIKMFEAFEAAKLTKTLSHVGKGSVDKFILELSRVAESIDFPMSKFSDRYFKYLSFNKALSLNIKGNKCTASSLEEFGEFGIEGENCVEGKIKRKWGTRTRQVICPECSGTAIKKSEGDIGLIKFWFNKNSEYLGATMVDGVIRNPTSTKTRLVLPELSNYLENSQNLDDYIVLEKMTSFDEIVECPQLSFLNIRIGEFDIIGRLWIENNNSRYDNKNIFILQDFVEGSTPTNEEWKKYAKFSTSIPMRIGNAYTLLPKKLNIDIPEEIDPYTWNAPFSYGYSTIRYTNSVSLRSIVDNASYALILDYKDLKNSKFNKRSNINNDRIESVKNAQFLLSDEEIRQTNFRKYISSLNYEVSKDINNVKFTLFRILGFKYFGINILNSYHGEALRDSASYIFDIIRDNEKPDGYNSRYLKNLVRERYIDSVNHNSNITKHIDDINKRDVTYKKITDKILELNQTIYDKFYNMKIETFEDLEVFLMKIRSLSEFYKNQSRYDIYYFKRTISNIADYNYYNYLDSTIDENKFEEFVEYFKKVIDKL